MTQRERESLASGQADGDPNSLLFGDDADGDGADQGDYRLSRADRRRSAQAQRRRRSRRGLWFVLLAAAIVAAVAALLVPRIVDYFSVPDYSGSGTGSVVVTIPSGASIKDMGDILHDKGVVKSAEAFTDAAGGNSQAQSIQPGKYELKRHMSGKAALDLMLSPTTLAKSSRLLVTEGETSLAVKADLVKLYGQDKAAEITKALANTEALSVPTSYRVDGKFPSSVEGFLYPATYNFDSTKTPTETLTSMVLRFVQQDRSQDDGAGFAPQAKKVGLTPYQALIVASIAQSEAKYDADMPKVVRTILNRLKAGTPLQFDSTSAYACRLAGTPANKCIYHQVTGPYNTYDNTGLPPTPIDNPGAAAMAAAVAPAANPSKGQYIWFVNIDKAGHLGFFTTEQAFEKARVKCVKNNWGCG